MTVRVDVMGEAELLRNLVMWQKRYPRATSAAVFNEALRIFAESQREVPVDTGNLRASGFIVPTSTRGLKFGVVIGYNTHYALAVHERTEVRHTVGKAKYLEDPWRKAQGGMLQRILVDAMKFAKGGRVPQPKATGGGEPPGRGSR